MKSKKRYLSDFPFVFSLMFFTLAFAKAFDAYIANTFMPQDSTLTFFRWIQLRYGVMAVNTLEMLAIVLIIWFRSKKKTNFFIFSMYAMAWILVLMLTSTYDEISKSVSYMVVPVLVALIATFIFTYRHKRLASKFNSLYVAIGTIIYAGSQFIRPFLIAIGPGWGYGWLSEIIDLFGWLIIFWGFFKPAISIKKEIAIEKTLIS
ncbi:MAG TPA: hypothetical protein VKM55_27720 [Candidatus Lokiarchaeia archaeon]|nr:hypothetical protein [Candidatus Lokiarchaeia archaeon]